MQEVPSFCSVWSFQKLIVLDHVDMVLFSSILFFNLTLTLLITHFKFLDFKNVVPRHSKWETSLKDFIVILVEIKFDHVLVCELVYIDI